MIDVSKYLHFSLETEIGTMDDDDSNAELQLQKVELWIIEDIIQSFFFFFMILIHVLYNVYI